MSRHRTPIWSEVTAILGGTFDPPHLGHAEALQGLFESPGVKDVVVLPTPLPPHKPSHASAEQRAEMTRLGLVQPFAGRARLDLRELERARQTPGRPTYSFDTLMEMRREIPQLAFVIGADQLEALPSWHRFPEVLGLCHWIILQRKPDGEAVTGRAIQSLASAGLIKPGAQGAWITATGTALQPVTTPARAVSSTAIREIIAKTGIPPERDLHPDVSAYLKLHRIYGTTSP